MKDWEEDKRDSSTGFLDLDLELLRIIFDAFEFRLKLLKVAIEVSYGRHLGKYN